MEKPTDWRRHLLLACALASVPPVVVPVLALGHFAHEGRFNREPLLDLVANRRLAGLPEVA